MIAMLYGWLVAAAWKGSLLVALVLLVTLVLRQRIPPRWRFALLFVAMLRLVVPVAPLHFTIKAPVRTPALHASEDRTPLRGAPVSSPAHSRAPFPWRTLAVAIWLSGTCAILIRITIRSASLRRRVRTSTAAPELAALLHENKIELRLTDAVSSPSLHGLWKPALLLPANLPRTLTAEQLRFVFLHELAHYRRSDVLLNWIATLIHALHWFNPLVWLAVSRLAEDRELACDALALAAIDREQRTAYGATVIQMLDQLSMPSPVPALVGMAPTRRHAKRRIQMIATFRKESRRSAWFAVAVAALALVAMTDARAGEQQTVVVREMTKGPAEGQAIPKTLEKPLSMEFTKTPLEDIVRAIDLATLTNIKFADDVLTQEIRDARITLTAKDLPAHIALNEVLGVFDLAAKYDDFGATIVKAEPGKNEIVIERVGEAGSRHTVTVSKQSHTDRMRSSSASTGEIVTKRSLKFQCDDNKEGTLEIEVKR